MSSDVGQIESIIGFQWGQKNPNPRAHRSSGKRGLRSFPPKGGPEGWDFSGTTEHQWSILFLIYHDRTVQYCVVSVGDVTEIDVYSQWRAMLKSTWNSEQTAHFAMNKWFFHQNGFTRTSLSATVSHISNRSPRVAYLVLVTLISHG